MAPWEDLPLNLVYKISQHLKSYDDYARFRAVCISWNSGVPRRSGRLLKQPVPMLILPFDDESQTSRRFYSFLEGKVYHLDLTETRDKYFRGSFDGWVVTTEKGPALFLFDPFRKVQIPLPPVSSFPYVSYCLDRHGAEYVFPKDGFRHHHSQSDMQRFPWKIVRSPTPIWSNHYDYLFVAIYAYDRLAYRRCEGPKWTAAERTNRGFLDVIFHEGKIYAITGGSGVLAVADADSFPLTFIPVPLTFSNISKGNNIFARKYFVGPSDGLMLVERVIFHRECRCIWYIYKTIRFVVYKLDLSNDNLSWSKRYKHPK